MLKESIYNVYEKSSEKIIMYNTLYGGMAELSLEEYDWIKNLSSHFFTCDEIELLVKNGFLIENEINEARQYNSIRQKIMELENKETSKNYTIAVTTDCNARCAYCFEKNISKVTLNYVTADNIINYIVHNSKGLLPVRITWFGGEPLLNSELISYLCEGLRGQKVSFTSSMITNGYLFSKINTQDLIKKWNLILVQITLDGIYEEYNQIKNYYGNIDNAFIEVIDNIEMLTRYSVNVCVRVNIGRNNIRSIMNVIKYLSDRFPMNDRIFVYPAFISSPNDINSFSEEEKIEIIRDFVSELPFFSRMVLKEQIFGLPLLFACMREDRNSVFIDADGSIGKCERLVGKCKEYNVKNETDFYNLINDYVCKESCYQCAFFPKCLGGCMEIRKQNASGCSVNKYLIKAMMRDFI